MTRAIAVILASGSGIRAGFSRPKQLVKLAGRPIVAHTLERFQSHPDIDEIAIVASDSCKAEIEALVSRHQFTKVRRVLLGGQERYESSLSAIKAYSSQAQAEPLKLLFHDAVRPLVSHQVISDVITALAHYDAVDTAVRASDTVIFADPTTNTIRDIPDRRLLRFGQTPQGFDYDTIKQAYELAVRDSDFRTTDDCGVVRNYMPNTRIYVVDGAPSNMKLTYAEDLLILDKLIQTSAGKRLDAEPETLRLSALEGRTLVVIGGTSGIGAAMAVLAEAYGARVYAVGRSTGVDVTDIDSLQACFDDAAATGQIDGVVNAAGILNRQPLINMTAAEIADSVNTNITGAINVAHVAHPQLQASRGHLMMFTSSSYTYGRAYYSTYSSSKAAVVNLTQALADEWSDADIKVNCINPARAATPMRTRAFGKEPSDTLLDPDYIARRALGVLVGNSTGLVYDVTSKS